MNLSHVFLHHEKGTEAVLQGILFVRRKHCLRLVKEKCLSFSLCCACPIFPFPFFEQCRFLRHRSITLPFFSLLRADGRCVLISLQFTSRHQRRVMGRSPPPPFCSFFCFPSPCVNVTFLMAYRGSVPFFSLTPRSFSESGLHTPPPLKV